MKIIASGKGRGKVPVKVSDEDYERVKGIKWQTTFRPHFDHEKNEPSGLYTLSVYSTVDKETIWMHRFILGVNDSRRVRHKNGIMNDNRRENLEVLPPKEESEFA